MAGGIDCVKAITFAHITSFDNFRIHIGDRVGCRQVLIIPALAKIQDQTSVAASHERHFSRSLSLRSQLSKPVVPSLPSESSAHNRGRTVGIVSILTVVVACFGYFREAALAAHFGLSTTMDAYFAAIFVPTIFYMILIAGTLSPIFIPILLSTENGGSPQKLTETFSVVTTFVLLFLIVIVSGAMLTAPSWLAVLFPGFSASTAAMSTPSHLHHLPLGFVCGFGWNSYCSAKWIS